ncbi:hypothetical protein [Chromobacterium sp. ASV23]|uniref:hypothetical protein n=1 Tax=Chromobacterium sp. ASV23 TaxID=2795110 RepID=UPI0018EB2382|nr:hypothetical protein [Chromobacterium sp. ASV23]
MTKTHSNCIKCLTKPADADSHVVPNSIRKRLYGEKKNASKKFSFSYVGRPDLPTQDFPKPKLMCRECDSKFGSDLEKTLPQLLMPADVDSPESWNELGLIPLDHGPFKDYPPKVKPLLKRNAALIAWKVMHAVARDGKAPDLSKFLHSPDGQALDREMLSFITQPDWKPSTISLKEPVLWKIEPKTAAALTREEDELPISWTVNYEPQQPKTAIIFAVFGFWIVGWQLPESTLSLHDQLAHWLLYIAKQKAASSQAV